MLETQFLSLWFHILEKYLASFNQQTKRRIPKQMSHPVFLRDEIRCPNSPLPF